MDIKLIPESGTRFVFSSLPEKITGKQAAKYQSFDIISQGTVKVPKGTDVIEVTWEGEFFGRTKRNEALVKSEHWQEPIQCVNIITEFMKNEAVLNLIVTETWINLDVTISSFQPVAYGAYGNIKYSITFVQKKPLLIYTTNELKIASYTKKTKARLTTNITSGSYVVKLGDTLWGISTKYCGGAANWTKLYDKNVDIIEKTAISHGMASSDHGHWIWPGEVLILV